jgi:hypothetical protein
MRTDDYKNAIAISTAELREKVPEEVAKAGGAEFRDGRLSFRYLIGDATIDLPDWKIAWAAPRENEDFPLTDQVLVLHYFQNAKGDAPTGEMAAYRQIPGGEFYHDAFRRRAEVPLANVFGRAPGLLTKASAALGGEIRKDSGGDEAALFRVFPRIDVQVLVYLGDEEFDPSGKVLFDKVAGKYLSNEDISWLGSSLVYRLMGAAKNLA